MTERDPLLLKLKDLSGDALIAAGLNHVEIMRLITLLEADGLPPGYAAFYRVTRPCIDRTERSVAGPGIGHDVPVFQTDLDAERMARCLGRAFAAGQRDRSADLMKLLDPRR